MPNLCGTAFTCPDTVNDLGTLGTYINTTLAAHWISDWNQSGRSDVGTGVCMGMCLDWIRRILTGLSSGDLAKAQSAIAPSFGFVDKRSAERWDEQKTAHRLYHATQTDIISELLIASKIRGLRAQLMLLSPQLDPVNPGIGRDLSTVEGLMTAVGDIANDPTTSLTFVNDFQSFVTNYLQPALQGITPSETLVQFRLSASDIYREFSTRADTAIKTGLLFKTVRSHNFASLQVEGAPTVFDPGHVVDEDEVLDFIDVALQALAAGRCAVLSLGSGGASGHDVAFYVGPSRGFFCYFDPNLGEFHFLATRLAAMGQLLGASWRGYFHTKGYTWLSWTVYRR